MSENRDTASVNPKKSFRWKRLLAGIGLVLLLVAAAAGAWVMFQVRAFDASLQTVYDVPAPAFVHSIDPAVVARGKHLAESVAACATSDCHGVDLSGGRTLQLGPLGNFTGPNITPAGLAAVYSDGELARVIQHGIKRNGQTVRMMPSHEVGWFPGADIAAIVSFVRSVPAVEKPNGEVSIGVLGKVLDRNDKIVLDVARKIDHSRATDAPLVPEPTARYGAYLVRSCTGCHGDHLGGGRIPGAPASMTTPANLTPHETGLATWGFDDFSKVLETGVRPDGRKLSKDMPYEALSKTDLTERKALWAYLRALPPAPFGSR